MANFSITKLWIQWIKGKNLEEGHRKNLWKSSSTPSPKVPTHIYQHNFVLENGKYLYLSQVIGYGFESVLIPRDSECHCPSPINPLSAQSLIHEDPVINGVWVQIHLMVGIKFLLVQPLVISSSCWIKFEWISPLSTRIPKLVSWPKISTIGTAPS